MAKKKAAAAEALGDAAVLNALEKELGCGPGEDVLTRARLMKEELDKAKAAGAFREEAKDMRSNMRSTLGLPGDADWAAITEEVARVRALVDRYGELKQEYDKLVSEKADADDALLRAQKALSDTELDEKARRKSMVSDIGRALGKDEQDWDWENLVVEVTGMKRELREAQEEYDSLRVQLAKSNEEAGNLQSQIDVWRRKLEAVATPPVITSTVDAACEREALAEFALGVLRGDISLIFHSPKA